MPNPFYIGGRVVNSAGFVSSSINWVTSSLWDHFEFWFPAEQMALVKSILAKHGMPTNHPDEGGYLGAHAGDGIQFRALDYAVPTRERRYQYPISPRDAARNRTTVEALFEAFVVAAFKRVGTPYAYSDIAALLFHTRALTPLTREICSEFGFLAPAEVGIFFLNAEVDYASLITPETLHLSPLWMGNCKYIFPMTEPVKPPQPKPSIWSKIVAAIGSAIGNAKFGG